MKEKTYKRMLIGLFIVLIFYLTMNFLTINAFGQDFDPCFIDNDMYQQVCTKHDIERVIDSLLQRTREWNNLTEHCNQTNFDECLQK